MGMPAARDQVTTIDQLLALPEDGFRHELLDGVHAVTPAPAPPHQRVVAQLVVALHAALQDREDMEVLTSPADIVLGPKSLVQPDVFIVHTTPGTPLESWSDVGVPLVAIEVLSPTTAPRDRGVKRRIYQKAGVAEYWIVDLDARLIERWTPEDNRPVIIDRRLHTTLPGGAKVEVDVEELFQRVER